MEMYLKIKELLEQRRMTQQEFGEALNVTSQTAFNYLNGRTKITADIVPEIAKFLRVPITSLYKSSDELNTMENMVNEPLPDYVLNNANCKDKDILIESQQETIKLLKQRIAMLEGQKS